MSGSLTRRTHWNTLSSRSEVKMSARCGWEMGKHFPTTQLTMWLHPGGNTVRHTVLFTRSFTRSLIHSGMFWLLAGRRNLENPEETCARERKAKLHTDKTPSREVATRRSETLPWRRDHAYIFLHLTGNESYTTFTAFLIIHYLQPVVLQRKQTPRALTTMWSSITISTSSWYISPGRNLTQYPRRDAF